MSDAGVGCGAASRKAIAGSDFGDFEEVVPGLEFFSEDERVGVDLRVRLMAGEIEAQDSLGRVLRMIAGASYRYCQHLTVVVNGSSVQG